MLVAMVTLQLWCNKENYQDFLWKGRYSLALHNLINNFRGEKWMYIENSKTCMKRQNSVPLRNMKNRLFFLKWEHFQNHYGNHLFPCNGWIYLHRKALNNMCVCVCVCVYAKKIGKKQQMYYYMWWKKKDYQNIVPRVVKQTKSFNILAGVYLDTLLQDQKLWHFEPLFLLSGALR